jgi:hypothetical protein
MSDTTLPHGGRAVLIHPPSGGSDAVAAGEGGFELQYAHPRHPLPGLKARPLPVGEVAERNTQ